MGSSQGSYWVIWEVVGTRRDSKLKCVVEYRPLGGDLEDDNVEVSPLREVCLRARGASAHLDSIVRDADIFFPPPPHTPI